MESKEFIIKMSAHNADADWALSLENVQSVIISAVSFSSSVYVDSIVEFNPADYKLTRTGKIGAIKAIRDLMQCTLLEAKMIADTAAARTGKTTVFGVTVDYDPACGHEAYHVSRA